MTSATDKLRQMLDERGVKWWPMRNNGYYEERDTEFVADGKKHTAHEWGDGLAVYNLTPEQAIAATLGRANVDDALALLDEMNEQGRIEYADYSQLHDAIAATLGSDHPKRNEQWTTVLLPDIAWRGADWPDYISVAHDINGEWRAYVPEMNGTLTAEDVRSFLNRNSVFDDTTWPHGRQELVFDEDDLQAMADELNAKFGRGTCHDVWQDDPFANFKCSECNGELHYRDKKRIACCPFCKREVIRV